MRCLILLGNHKTSGPYLRIRKVKTNRKKSHLLWLPPALNNERNWKKLVLSLVSFAKSTNVKFFNTSTKKKKKFFYQDVIKVKIFPKTYFYFILKLFFVQHSIIYLFSSIKSNHKSFVKTFFVKYRKKISFILRWQLHVGEIQKCKYIYYAKHFLFFSRKKKW